jgi:hypothetical protein
MEKIEHTNLIDKMGCTINLDDLVVFADSNNGGKGYRLNYGRVTSWNKSQVFIRILNKEYELNTKKNLDKVCVITEQRKYNEEYYTENLI